MSINRSLHKIAKEGVVQTLEAKDKEIERLNNIINKTIESVQEHYDNSYSTDDVNDIGCDTYDDLMKILKGIDEQ